MEAAISSAMMHPNMCRWDEDGGEGWGGVGWGGWGEVHGEVL